MKDIINTQVIKDYIITNKLTKTDFCKLCEISVSTLNRLFSGEDIYITTLFKIAKVMKVSIYLLFN